MTALRKKKNVESLVDMAGRSSPWRDVWHRLKKNKLAIIGMALMALVILSAVFADVIAPYDYMKQSIPDKLQFPSIKHLLGTDDFGRDILSRIIYGGRISLLVSLLAVCISTVIGSILGATSGYFGGVYESIVMRFMDILMAIPGFLLAVSISAALGSGVTQTAIAIAITGIPNFTRIVRASVLSIRDQEFIEAARATGASNRTIIFTQILPNILAPIIVNISLRLGGNILMISSLSFIGLGVTPPTPEWGSMMASGRAYIRDFYPLTVFPGIAIMITLFGFNLLGDGLRDAMDPRLKQ